ncbi:hypothetical protein HMPREF1492_0092 [Atopobium sp. BS2]|nr:hypothetical protein HMPREF1492_0092 [Atopobium sp. BS2]
MFKKRKRAHLCTPSVYINHILSDTKIVSNINSISQMT